MTDNWQPIETAPKDGTYVILYVRNGGVGRPSVGRWVDIVHTNYGAVTYERREWVLDGGLYMLENPPVTHWMPFPDHPGHESV